MKTCFKCHERKPLSEFYRHPKMADGRLGKCKPCARSDVRTNRAARADYYREYDLERWQSDPKRRENKRKQVAKQTPTQIAARNAVSNAVRDGRMKKPDKCSRCHEHVTSRKLHGHHDDYTKPLSVRWLCAACHHQHHGLERRI